MAEVTVGGLWQEKTDNRPSVRVQRLDKVPASGGFAGCWGTFASTANKGQSKMSDDGRKDSACWGAKLQDRSTLWVRAMNVLVTGVENFSIKIITTRGAYARSFGTVILTVMCI